MRRHATVALAVMAVLVSTTSQAQTLTGTLKKVKDSGTLTIGYRENALPFSFTGSDGKPTGYSIDLCKEIAVAVQQDLKSRGPLGAVGAGHARGPGGRGGQRHRGHRVRLDDRVPVPAGEGRLHADDVRRRGDAPDRRGRGGPHRRRPGREARSGRHRHDHGARCSPTSCRVQSIAATVVPVKDHDEGAGRSPDLQDRGLRLRPHHPGRPHPSGPRDGALRADPRRPLLRALRVHGATRRFGVPARRQPRPGPHLPLGAIGASTPSGSAPSASPRRPSS